jgi:hypothetical protein
MSAELNVRGERTRPTGQLHPVHATTARDRAWGGVGRLDDGAVRSPAMNNDDAQKAACEKQAGPQDEPAPPRGRGGAERPPRAATTG